jgi:RNA polymerase sigma factor (sigma-70 family)
VLADPADVEDAFQATFVVLMRGPGRVRDGRAVGSWLYGVAHRVALKALAHRRRREAVEAGAESRSDSTTDLSWREACAVLHEELDRLPDEYRLPLLLCYLEGRSRDEAAQQLGRTLNSVKKALETGRERLRKRLKGRGVTLSAGLLSAVVTSGAGLPSGLVQAAVGSVGTPGPVVAALARAASPARAWKSVGAGLAASVVIAGVALGVPRADQLPAKPAAAKAGPTDKADKLPDVIRYAGTVTGPDGKPVNGAKLWLSLDGESK